MDISPSLKADLAELTRQQGDLNQTAIDLEGSIKSFAAAGALTVESLAGLSLTVFVDNQAITVTSMNEATAGDIAASIKFPLQHSTTNNPETTDFAVLYAHTAGAFVDLAADLAITLRPEEHQIKLDSNLADATESKVLGSHELSTIHHAQGVLMAPGNSAENAMTELAQQAAKSHLTVLKCAERLLGGLHTP